MLGVRPASIKLRARNEPDVGTDAPCWLGVSPGPLEFNGFGGSLALNAHTDGIESVVAIKRVVQGGVAR